MSFAIGHGGPMLTALLAVAFAEDTPVWLERREVDARVDRGLLFATADTQSSLDHPCVCHGGRSRGGLV